MRPIRTYSEVRRLRTFEERFEYLMLRGAVAEKTFGFNRWLNQNFYASRQWHLVRDEVIVRDHGCDLGIRGHDLRVGLLVHHMTPLTMEDIMSDAPWILDPENLITTSLRTHNAIHYGNRNLLPQAVVVRSAGDTRLW